MRTVMRLILKAPRYLHLGRLYNRLGVIAGRNYAKG